MIHTLLLATVCFAASPEKPVYNSFLFTGPNGETAAEWQVKLNKRTGMQPCKWLFHEELFDRHPDGGWDNSGWIDAVKVSRTIRGFPKGTTVFVNLENGGPHDTRYWQLWDKNGMSHNPAGIEHRTDLLRYMKRENPFCRYGYYGQIPYPDERTICGHHLHVERGRRMLLAWKPVADEADFLVPQIYADSDWSEAFTLRYIAASIICCRDYYPRRKIYPILWVEFYDKWQQDSSSEGFKKRVIPYWGAMLETAYSLADGVVLWGGHRVEWQGGHWWRTTKDFLIRRGVAPVKHIEKGA